MSVIKVENLGKRYIIDHQKQNGRYNYSTLGSALTNSGKKTLNFLKHPLTSFNNQLDHEEFWALKDINFEIQQGDRVGIIGRNGAGKSTLLKILSRITAPTTGQVRIKGRVSSLLEVGTGFHPELTGRENIYLNGAILGMKRQEIKAKFDEIVAFAEVEKFLDTPVKHYSSGMYVRLAFAVAAHLEPEILIVDEVLAVGDAQFQKKCLGKMEEIGKEGRTILMVSHNLASVKGLCSKGMMIMNNLEFQGSIDHVITHYLKNGFSVNESLIEWHFENAPKSAEIVLKKAYVLDYKGEHAFNLDLRHEFSICIEYEILKSVNNLRVGIQLQNAEGLIICGSNDPGGWHNEVRKPGKYVTKCIFPSYVLNHGKYFVNFGVDKAPYSKALISTINSLSFSIEDVVGHWPTYEILPGIIRPNLNWQVDFLGV